MGIRGSFALLPLPIMENRDPRRRFLSYAQVAAGGKIGGFSAPSGAALEGVRLDPPPPPSNFSVLRQASA